MTTLRLPEGILLALAYLKIVSNGERPICSEAPNTKNIADTHIKFCICIQISYLCRVYVKIPFYQQMHLLLKI